MIADRHGSARVSPTLAPEAVLRQAQHERLMEVPLILRQAQDERDGFRVHPSTTLRVLNAASSPRNLVVLLCAVALAATSFLMSGTSAYFTAATTLGANTFTTVDIDVTTTTLNSGTSCTASGGNNASGCGAAVQLLNMVPGDRTLGTIRLSNAAGATHAAITNWLNVTASASSLLDSTTLGSGGLGLLVFRCYSGAASPAPASVSTVVDCNTAPGAGTSLFIQSIYPAASTTPCSGFGATTAVDPFGASRGTHQLAASTALNAPGVVTTPSNASTQTLSILGASGTSTCTGGNAVTGSQVALGGPDAVPGIVDTGTSAQARGLATGSTDYVTALVYAPSSMSASMETLTSTLQLTITSEQRIAP